jgi:FKBP-type peptidyl-prolyl cis-trans isomerase
MEFLSIEPEQITANGVRYVDLVDGYGGYPTDGDKLIVNYTGWLQADGTKFDSSLDPGKEPFSFTLGASEVIRGWDEGFAGMGVGGKRILIIPPEMAYGEQGTTVIPPNSTLVFEVDLLQIQ